MKRWKRLLKWAAMAGGGLAVGGLLLTLGETLHWWRLWRRPSTNVAYGRKTVGENRVIKTRLARPSANCPIDAGTAGAVTLPYAGKETLRRAIVWLSGVSDYGDSEWLPEQQAFVERLAAECPGSVVVKGNLPVNGETDRRFRRADIWRLMGWTRPPLWVWGLHNFWQFALAAVCEGSYGKDVARIAVERLRLAGVPSGSPVLFVCGSAGAQVALACAPALREQGYEPIYVVALGGAFGSPQGFKAVVRFAQLTGEKDGWSKVGAWLFPGRRLSMSTCARALKEGRMAVYEIGPHGHYGAYSYLDNAHFLPDGRTYADMTFAAIVQLPWWKEWAEA